MSQYQLVVGSEDFCDYRTIREAVTASLPNTVIYILEGAYNENVQIYQNNLKLVGVGNVILESNLRADDVDKEGKLLGTFRTATLFINCPVIHLENLSIKNTANSAQVNGQAIALYSEVKELIVINCRISSRQDTLCLGPLPKNNKDGTLLSSQFIRNKYNYQRSIFSHCYIEGDIDFIFGGGNAVFENCQIKALKNLYGEFSYITASSTPKNQEKGFFFSNCFISGESFYLGRPWRPYAKVVYENCRIGSGILEKGWHDWGKLESRKTVTFSEVNNSYKNVVEREKWIDFYKTEES